jgi:hypothetical protein
MRTGRAIIVSALIALGAAGSILAAAGHAPAAHVQTTASKPSTFMHS